MGYRLAAFIHAGDHGRQAESSPVCLSYLGAYNF